jgi:hypothetical protein
MDVVFLCIQGGKSFYRVVLNGQEIFVGTRGECTRFIEIHNEKVAQEHIDQQKTPRGRPVSIRTYQVRAQA